MKVVKEFPDGPGATQLVVEKTTPLKLPNSKGGGSWVKEIHNERAHLTIYRLDPREHGTRRPVVDQFDKYELTMLSTAMLAVPTSR